MLKRSLGVALGWLALTALQAPPAAPPTPRAELSLWRLDCGEFVFTDYNAFFSDTSEYAPGSKRLVGSCYLIRHGEQYMLWDSGIPGATVTQPIRSPAVNATLRSRIVDQLARINVRPEQVTILGLSHYHFDHS